MCLFFSWFTLEMVGGISLAKFVDIIKYQNKTSLA